MNIGRTNICGIRSILASSRLRLNRLDTCKIKSLGCSLAIICTAVLVLSGVNPSVLLTSNAEKGRIEEKGRV